MKKALTVALTSLSLLCLGQNTTPQIEITSIEADQTAEILTVNYTLNDVDGDACEIWLKMSTDAR